MRAKPPAVPKVDSGGPQEWSWKEPAVICWNKIRKCILFIQCVFINYLLCVGPCAESWRCSDDIADMFSGFKELAVSRGNQTLLKYLH